MVDIRDSRRDHDGVVARAHEKDGHQLEHDQRALLVVSFAGRARLGPRRTRLRSATLAGASAPIGFDQYVCEIQRSAAAAASGD